MPNNFSLDEPSPINNDDPDSQNRPLLTRLSMHDETSNAQTFTNYTQDHPECMICLEPYKIGQYVTILSLCRPRPHVYHNFCIWGRIFDMGFHKSGRHIVLSCPVCAVRFHLLDIVNEDVPATRKLNQRVSEQGARIFATQPPASRVNAPALRHMPHISVRRGTMIAHTTNHPLQPSSTPRTT